MKSFLCLGVSPVMKEVFKVNTFLKVTIEYSESFKICGLIYFTKNLFSLDFQSRQGLYMGRKRNIKFKQLLKII